VRGGRVVVGAWWWARGGGRAVGGRAGVCKKKANQKGRLFNKIKEY
jgi:hypothetical protein